MDIERKKEKVTENRKKKVFDQQSHFDDKKCQSLCQNRGEKRFPIIHFSTIKNINHEESIDIKKVSILF